MPKLETNRVQIVVAQLLCPWETVLKDFLNTPQNNTGTNFTNPRSVLSNQMLDAKIKQLKKEGMQNTNYIPAIDKERRGISEAESSSGWLFRFAIFLYKA